MEKILFYAHGWFKRDTLKQYSGYQHRELLFGAEYFIIEHLEAKHENKKEALLETITYFQELCAISYFTEIYQQCRKIQCRVRVLTHLLPSALLKLFGKEGRNRFWSNYLHHLLNHMAQEFEITPLPSVSMERFEQSISKQNKVHHNNSKINFLIRFMAFKPKPSKKKKISERNTRWSVKWLSEHIWKELSVLNGKEEKSLLKELTKYGYKEGIHWKLSEDEKKITFCTSDLLKSSN